MEGEATEGGGGEERSAFVLSRFCQSDLLTTGVESDGYCSATALDEKQR